MRLLLPILALAACNPDPGYPEMQVDYRDIQQDGPSSGERGNIIITELLWSGSVRESGGSYTWDPSDVFIEIKNQGTLPVDVTRWIIDLNGPVKTSWRLPNIGRRLETGEYAVFAAKSTGCFPDADGFLDGFRFPPPGDPIELTLRDADERLIEPVGSRTMPPYAGTYDLVVSRSMERIELMFGANGSSPHLWHHYTNHVTPDVPNNDLVAPECRARTYASPGRANSQDYSGSFAAGGVD